MQPADAPEAGGVRTALAVVVGGALGALLRHGLSGVLPVDPVGVGTVVVNLTGSLALGILVSRPQAPVAVAFWRTGLLGSFTTFGAVTAQAAALPIATSAAYLAVQMGLGLAAAAVGLRLGGSRTGNRA